jgi:hypothetical protein
LIRVDAAEQLSPFRSIWLLDKYRKDLQLKEIQRGDRMR